jgi:hypothetical protein
MGDELPGGTVERLSHQSGVLGRWLILRSAGNHRAIHFLLLADVDVVALLLTLNPPKTLFAEDQQPPFESAAD